jgi:hypothetical protein
MVINQLRPYREFLGAESLYETTPGFDRHSIAEKAALSNFFRK